MNELETNRQRAQLLVKARALLNEEYLKNRTAEYEQWQADANRMWISQGILLPCPNKFAYPTEEAIVAKALELYNNQNAVQASTVNSVKLPETAADMTSSVSAKLAEVSRKFTPVVLPEVPNNITPWEQYLAPETEQSVEPVSPAPSIDIPVPEPIIKDAVAKEEVEEIGTAEELEQVIEEVLEENYDPSDKKQTSTLRTLLAQFVTLAKKLDADKSKEETK